MSENRYDWALKNKAFYLYKEMVTKEFLTDWSGMVAQKRVAIYARVSTVDKGQDPETQLMALRDYAERRGFAIVTEYIDYALFVARDQSRAILA